MLMVMPLSASLNARLVVDVVVEPDPVADVDELGREADEDGAGCCGSEAEAKGGRVGRVGSWGRGESNNWNKGYKCAIFGKSEILSMFSAHPLFLFCFEFTSHCFRARGRLGKE